MGKNGSGKSTMLKLILGINKPTEGLVLKPSGLTIGYLPQQMEHAKDKTVLEEALTAFSCFFDMQKEMERINMELSSRDDYESNDYHKLIVSLNDINDRIHYYGSENPEGLAEKTLIGLGFNRDELNRQTHTFSQGWNMRIELAKVLLKKPDLLLLDEPTNHLDIESIQWLEEYLENYYGSLVLISHDKKFLDNATNRTVELMLGRAYDYKVSYSKYLELRKERIEQQKAAYDNQLRKIEKTEEFIEKFRYKATKSNQVQSRIKQLDKIERIEIDDEDRSVLTVKFPPSPRSGQVVVNTTDLKMQFGEKVVFDKANITIERGEKVALVGRNGEGKTTLIRLIINEISPKSGLLELGHNVSVGYYAQNQEDLLDKNDTVLDTLDKIAVGVVRTKLRDILGAFLFKGDDISKKVAVLSGGERARLAMAKLMLKPHNLLVLDEPTNHMDIRSKDVLKRALINYDGTLILVSHDRDFLDGLVNKIYEFKDGRVKEHLGGVMEFLSKKKIEHLRELEISSPDNRDLSIVKEKRKEILSHQEQKEIERELRKKRNSIESCEERIDSLEKKIVEIEKTLANPPKNKSLEDLLTDYNGYKKELDIKLEEWAGLQS